jgi:type I restriction enzyme R subunit
MKPEESARKRIDELLELAGWKIQDYENLNLGAGIGVAVREYPLKTGFADYMLFVERHAVGVVEAKPAGTTLSGVSEQTEKYLRNFPELQTWEMLSILGIVTLVTFIARKRAKKPKNQLQLS